MKNKLPKNWVETDLDTVILRMTNGSSLKQEEEPFQGSLPISRIETIWNETIDLDRVKYVDASEDDIEKYGLQKGDVLFSHINSDKHLGKTAVFNLDQTIIHGINLLLLRAMPQFDGDLLNYILRHYRFSGKFIEVAQRSVNQSSINQKKLKSFLVPLPPLAEQQRIVAKLDELFGHLDSLKTRLNHIPEILKNFRQAVLNQAVTGKLTEEWRVGKALEEWEEVELETIAKVVDPQPSHRTPPIHEDGIPYVSIKDVNKKGEVILENARPVSKVVLAEHIKRYDLQEGDFGFGKIGTLGKPFLLPMFPERKYTLSANIILIQPRSKGNPKFLYYYLNSSIIEQKLREGTNSTSQPAFGIKKARKFPTPNPSPEEQTEIVKRVEHLFDKADAIEAQYQSLKTKIDSLPQAILAKAFKGELVAQLDSDGSAAILLEEIKKLNASLRGTKQSVKKSKKTTK
ncbi:restriction endonuclease subunit S [Lacinutrix sp. 5H-3-7-4]|uniref:restriction endonuclease subunit S n=1 Tax=Lacinutrix sp. (strain 5H-3-7-4) TaxID=983544 RepID=UPI00020A3C25|nr:restriction endonuclease subunit S [Lacinutrix sp. 5H-3-7-4]AEH01971.1 restriction modification system DNA specificity domain protein [Lacinutrix sp. 5H-3-7-4]